MSDQINQKISQFLDDDLNDLESLQLLKAMQQQPHLQKTIQRYQLINQAVKSRPVLMADQHFADQIRQQLEQEPVYLLPQRRLKANPYKAVALGLAASIAAIAFIAPTVTKLNVGNHYSTASVAQQKLDATSTQVLVANVQKQTMRMYPVNKRFQGYLLAHNDSLYTNGAANFQNHTQLASYDQSK